MDIDIWLKLGLASLLGFIIGLERELRKKPIGLKTCFVLAVSSCVLTIVSIESAYLFEKTDGLVMDPLRLAAQIVTGVGFIGAGVILRRNNDVISGLTTAAMLWGASGLGIAVGAGFFYESIIGALFILIGVEMVPFLMKWIGPKSLRMKENKLRIVIEDNQILTDIIKEIKQKKINIKHVRVKDTKEGLYQLDLRIMVDEKRYTTDVYYEIHSICGVVNVDLEG
ncbi:MgtC/SapB family protein [Chengkuizengella axinellae]|uniref:MgtC/SapB family protein n=1 Tax=Chengkuizengella axinellae TaxID=3064388 RepID=A0ABT9ITW2_9BACL|nr:MgtC/SapB family protein [Chengkuizengella sp. 2205SS18-9]MDP5272757.1 MgtC/SapB family protein [Chengkuizengella sp. 2205SS18-9]